MPSRARPSRQPKTRRTLQVTCPHCGGSAVLAACLPREPSSKALAALEQLALSIHRREGCARPMGV